MAGYVLKIVLEDTHPPVWRRVMVPEKITFADLHDVIQVLFDWDGDHLHDFSTPSRKVTIGENEDSWGRSDFEESELLIDQFWDSCKWIRYTYDFGDDWRHKIIYEKTDETYEGRTAVFMKAKGDHFYEDVGKIWDTSEDSRYPFDAEAVKKSLENMVFPVCSGEILHIPESPREMMSQYLNRFLEEWASVQESRNTKTPSGIAQKVDNWKKHVQGQKDAVLELVPGSQTNAELLNDLSLKEVKDYCKYLQISVPDSWGKDRMVQELSLTFRTHPEYLLYVFFEEEYQEFQKWRRLSTGTIKNKQSIPDMPIKAIALGLLDAEFIQEEHTYRVKIRFAKDLEDILSGLKESRQTYRWLQSYSDKLKNFILVYGLIEMDALYDMFCDIYKEKISQADFRRFVYWHARFNNLLQTVYTADGTSYAASIQIDAQKVLHDQMNYAEDLDYQSYSRHGLKQRAQNPADVHDSLHALYEVMIYGMQLPESAANQMMNAIFERIKSGGTLTDVLDSFSLFDPMEEVLAAVCAVWMSLAAIMLELELPMLKGRSREEYASLKQISPWEIQMVSPDKVVENSKNKHIYEFPANIQEQIYLAGQLDRPSLDFLWNYQKKEGIISEEFLFLLAEAYSSCGDSKRAEKLIHILEKSSPRGQNAAKYLRQEPAILSDALDEDGDPFFWEPLWEDKPAVQQPYVRTAPKAGRNDPCPCGSGKKYKKCCGKNSL